MRHREAALRLEIFALPQRAAHAKAGYFCVWIHTIKNLLFRKSLRQRKGNRKGNLPFDKRK